jgi:hypothetical protein
MPDNQITNKIPIVTTTLSLNDIKQIISTLKNRLDEASTFEVNNFLKADGVSDEDFAHSKALLKESFKFGIIINGENGQSISGFDETIFDSPIFPDTVSSIYIESKASCRALRGTDPLNWLELNFDFTKPPLLDWKNTVSGPTPNWSSITVSGKNEAWVAAVIHGLNEKLKQRRNRRKFLHLAFTYDIFLWALMIPLGLWVPFKLVSQISSFYDGRSQVFEIATFIYVFFGILLGYRILFGYTKWAWPTIELEKVNSLTVKHRRFWYLVIVGVVSGLIVLGVAN